MTESREVETGAGPARDLSGYGRFPPAVRWPGDARLVISVVVNYESGAEHSLLDDGRNDTWGEHSEQVLPEIRDLGTEAQFEFGSRVGIWRLARLFDELRVPVSIGACARALERNPAVAEWALDAGHELIGHGYRWVDTPSLTRSEERDEMLRAVEVFERLTGAHPLGWYVRSFPSVHTRDLLVEEGGFLYDSDSCNDELPYFVEVRERPWLVVPYSKVYNDNRYFMAPTYATPRHFYETLRTATEYLSREASAGGTPSMMTVGLHERWSGQAARASAVRDFLEYAREQPGVALMYRCDIARWWVEHCDEWQAGSPRRSQRPRSTESPE